MTSSSLVALLALWLAGLGLLLSFRTRRALPALERHALAVLLGLAFVPALFTAILSLAGPLSVGAGRALLALVALPGVAALVLDRRRAAPLAPPGEGRATWLERSGIVLALFFAAFALFAASSMPMHVFDPVYHFAYKGKLVFREGFGTPAWTDVTGDIGRIITHPNYPPGVPVLHALVGWIGGAFDEDATRALMGLFVVCPAALLWCALRPRGRAPAAAAALAWTSLPLLYYSRAPHEELLKAAYGLVLGTPAAVAHWPAERWSMPDGWTLDGAGDLPLAALFFGAFYYLWRALSRAGERSDPWIAGALLGGAMLAKNEGLALAAVLGAALALWMLVARFGERRAQGGELGAESLGAHAATPAGTSASAARAAPLGVSLLRLAVAYGAALVLAAAWLVERRAIPAIDEDYGALLSSGGLWERLTDTHLIGVVWSGFWDTFTNALRWNLTWPLFFATLAWSLLRPRELARHPALAGVLVVLGAFALYALVLLVSPWDLPQLFTTVIPGRLVLHVTPIALLATLALLWRTRDEVRS